jgi:hypothetical protein
VSLLWARFFALVTYADMNLVVQTIGGAFLVSAGESAFEAVLTKRLRESDSAVSPITVIGTGATEVRTAFAPADLPFILRAYVEGIQTAFIVAITLACVCTVVAFGAKWQKLQSASKPGVASGTQSSTKSVEADAAA